MSPWLLQLLPIQVHYTSLGVTYAEIRSEVAGNDSFIRDRFINDVACLAEHQGRGKGLLAVPKGFMQRKPGYTTDSNTAMGDFLFNRPLPGCKNSHLQNEA